MQHVYLLNKTQMSMDSGDAGSDPKALDCGAADVDQMGYWLRHLEAQVEVSVQEADQPYNELASLFALLLKNEEARSDDGQEPTQGEQHLQDKVRKTIIAFQFYDRMHQRLEHVRDGLNALVSSLDSASQPERVTDMDFIQKTGSLYSQRQQQLIAEFARDRQSSIAEIQAMLDQTGPGSESDVELF